MASQKNTNVHLEAMEETGYESEEPEEARDAGMASTSKRKHSKRVLGSCGQWNTAPYHHKQKTCTQRIL